MPINGQYAFANAIEEMVLRFGKRNDPFFRGRLSYWLASAQMKIAKGFIEVPDLEDTIPAMPIVAGVSEYDVRTTAPALTNILGLQYIKLNSTGYKLRRFRFDGYMDLVQQASGPPVRWTRRGYLLVLDPKPNEWDTLRIMYRRRPEPGVIELDSDWQEDLIKLGMYIGWGALDEHDKARATFAEMSPTLQMVVSKPMDQGDFEAVYDQDYGITAGPLWDFPNG